MNNTKRKFNSQVNRVLLPVVAFMLIMVFLLYTQNERPIGQDMDFSREVPVEEIFVPVHIDGEEGRTEIFFRCVKLDNGITNAPTLIFIPDLFVNSRFYEPVLSHLVHDDQYALRLGKAFALDLPGTGRSGVPDGIPAEALTLDFYVEAAWGLLQEIADGEQVILAGHGMGGLVVQLLQQRARRNDTCLRKVFNVTGVLLVNPVPPTGVPWGPAEPAGTGSPLFSLLARCLPFGVDARCTEDGWLGYYFGNADNILTETFPEREMLEEMIEPSSPAVLSAVSGFDVETGETVMRPAVDEHCFAPQYGTSLSILVLPDSIFGNDENARALHAYLTGRSDDDMGVFFPAIEFPVHGALHTEPHIINDSLNYLFDTSKVSRHKNTEWDSSAELDEEPQLVEIDTVFTKDKDEAEDKLKVLDIVAVAKIGSTATTPMNERLVVATFNAQFLPTFFSPRADNNDDEKRGARVAKRIIAAKYDVIVLNEIFDEDTREVLVRDLKPHYPYFVSYLDGTGVEDLSDSGLMLFSKLPFDPLPNGTYKAGDCKAESNGSSWSDVAFIEFSESSGADSWAAKGVGYVRVHVPQSGRPLNLVFTHMQADYEEDDLDDWQKNVNVRKAQLNTIHEIIRGSMTNHQIMNEDIILFGDLNIDGDLLGKNYGWWPGRKSSMGYYKNKFEWNVRFGPPGSFFRYSLRDTWGYETSMQDRGITNENDETRYDYIHRSKFTQGDTEGLCVQQITRALNLRDRGESPQGPAYAEAGYGMAGWCDLSDHMGVNAVLNRWAAQSTPLLADTPLPKPYPLGKLEEYSNGNIVYPGGVQWFRYDQPGTYLFSITSGKGKLHVYQASDLSTPLLPYSTTTTTVKDQEGGLVTGKKYNMPQPPFFVRISNPTLQGTGSYTLFSKKFNGDSPDTAIALSPNIPYDYIMPQMPLNAQDRVWFELDLEKTTSDTNQSLILHCTPDVFSGDVFTLSLYKKDAKSEIARVTPGSGRIVIKREMNGPRKLYLVVQRKVNSHPTHRVKFTVGWETDLSVLHGAIRIINGISSAIPNAVSLKLTCIDQTDWFGDDEIYMYVIVDGRPFYKNRAIKQSYDLGDFDEGEFKTLDAHLGTIRFVEEVKFILVEDDDLSADDIFVFRIKTLPVGTLTKHGVKVRCSDSPDLFEGVTGLLGPLDIFDLGSPGEYQFQYNLSRSLK